MHTKSKYHLFFVQSLLIRTKDVSKKSYKPVTFHTKNVMKHNFFIIKLQIMVFPPSRNTVLFFADLREVVQAGFGIHSFTLCSFIQNCSY